MTSKSQIEWTEQTWNPAVGCTKVSAGCKHCYAETMANRLKFMGTKGYENGFRLTLMPDRLEQPLHRKIPTTYFVNSMSDLFHEKIPFDYLDKIMEVIKKTGAVGGLLSVQDIMQFRKGKIQGKERILRHLTRILASFIAVVTAVLVVNGAKLAIPELVNWLAPSVLITPLIIYMARSYMGTK